MKLDRTTLQEIRDEARECMALYANPSLKEAWAMLFIGADVADAMLARRKADDDAYCNSKTTAKPNSWRQPADDKTASANAIKPCSKCGKPNPILCCDCGSLYFGCPVCETTGPRSPTSQAAADAWDAMWKPKKQAAEAQFEGKNRLGLLPCPCCGEKSPEVFQFLGSDMTGFMYRIQCQGCKLTTDCFDSTTNAYSSWNRRAQFTPAETEHRESR